MSQSSFNGVCV